MIYSVWDQARGLYRYYEAGGPMESTNSPRPRHVSGGDKLGVPPELAAWPLPSGAREVGSGHYPRGHVAYRRGMGDLIDLSPTNLLLLGALGWVFYTSVWKKK